MMYPNSSQTAPSNRFRRPDFDCSAPSAYALHCAEAGRAFEEKMEDAFFADTGHRLERLTDLKLNSQPCDYFAILNEINLFMEIKWTSKPELHLSNIAEHQLYAMRDIDAHIPSCHAGFLMGLGERWDRQLWYLSGTALWRFVRNSPYAENIDSAYLRAHGIVIRYKYDPQQKKLHVFFREFLEAMKNGRRAAEQRQFRNC